MGVEHSSGATYPLHSLPASELRLKERKPGITSPPPMAMSSSLTVAARLCTCGPKPRKPKAQAQPKQKLNTVGFSGERKDQTWRCVSGCGACCKLDKGPSFATPEEIFDSTEDIQLYKSLVGLDGWCVHYDKCTRTCSIYSERPYFCRVEPGVFETLYGIDKKRFNKEACSCCTDTIKAIYGARSQEMKNFDQATRTSKSS